MKYSLLILIGLMTVPSVSWGENIICDDKEYSCYLQKAKSCTDNTAPWVTGSDLGVKTIAYEPFDPESFKKAIEKIESSKEAVDGKTSLTSELEAILDKNNEGFRAARIAGLQYRTNMNNIFSCAIVASRHTKLQKLEEIIKSNNRGTDIMKKLEREKERYKTLMAESSCSENTKNAKEKIVDRLAVSAAKEYCSYTIYLDYLDANIESDFSRAQSVDQALGTGTGGKSLTNSDQARLKFAEQMNVIQNERRKAQDTLPKAVMAYQEMDRTYIVHLLLTIIYNDYLTLRDNLNVYFSIISQTFEKAYNAQDANKK